MGLLRVASDASYPILAPGKSPIPDATMRYGTGG